MANVRRRRKHYGGLILLAVAFFVIIVGITQSKYINEAISNIYYKSREFYFYSRTLGIVNRTYRVDNLDGVSNYELNFNISNALNSNTWTADNIEYSVAVSCPASVICSPSETEGVLYHNDIHFTEKLIRIDVLPVPNSSLENGDIVDVDVEVESLAPYRKKMSATFSLKVSTLGIKFSVEDMEDSLFANLIISNTSDSSKNLAVSINDSKFALDMNNAKPTDLEDLNSNNYIDHFAINLDASDMIVIKLFKKDIAKNYTYPGLPSDFSSCDVEVMQL